MSSMEAEGPNRERIIYAELLKAKMLAMNKNEYRDFEAECNALLYRLSRYQAQVCYTAI